MALESLGPSPDAPFATPACVRAVPSYPPADWAPPVRDRDVALDLLRGLAIVILVVNHIHLDSALEHGTQALLSAAEVLVSVSGVVVGMVFGRRWLVDGARATTAMLRRRARKLYVASVVVVTLVGALSLVPGAATEALTTIHGTAADTYAYDSALRLAIAIVTLEAGPWQFNILGFFITVLAVAPILLWALDRGRWRELLVLSWALYATGRAWPVEVLPTQSERPFPILVWQLPFVHGLVIGWHRERISRALGDLRRPVGVLIAALAAGVAIVLLAAPAVAGRSAWTEWGALHFDKGPLDPARLLAMTAMTAGLYVAFTHHADRAARHVGWLLLPLGRNSFYVFIMHVFICLAVATVLAGDGLGLVGNTVVQVGCVAVLWAMVRRRFLFRWVPR